jgi:hypothetical protein
MIALACLVLAVVGTLGAAATALADGDPASDVLASQPLFIPQDGSIPVAQQSELTAIAASARREGFPLRVALIATRTDLGSVGVLWRQPADYARFLGVELSQVFHGTLLVVMPNGFGAAQVGGGGGRAGRDSAGVAALDGLRAPGSGASLATGALTAVQRLGGAAGHHLVIPRATGSEPISGARPNSGSSFDPAAWLALVSGAALIAAAWVASLRVRPLRRHDGVGSPHGS